MFYCRYDRHNYKQGPDKRIKNARLTEETQNAIRCFRALEGVSHERINNEFIQALEESIYPPRYLQLCHQFDLFPAMFGCELNQEYIALANTRYAEVALAMLIKNNDGKEVKKHLNSIKYSDIVGRTVVFLKSLLDFKSKDVYHMVRKRDSFVMQSSLREHVKDLCKLVGLSQVEMLRFMDFRPQSCAADFPELEGPELGEAIQQAVVREYHAL